MSLGCMIWKSTLVSMPLALVAGCGDATVEPLPSPSVVDAEPAPEAEPPEPKLLAIDAKKVRSLGEHTERFSEIKFSPDGTLLATRSGAADEAFVWSLPDFSVAAKLQDSESLAFSPDSQTLVISDSGYIRIWHRQTPNDSERSDVLSVSTVGPTQFVFIDGERGLLARDKEGVALTKLAPVAVLKEFKVPERSFNHVVASPDGKTFVAAGQFDESFRVGDAETGTFDREVELPGRFQAAAFSPDGSQLVVAGWSEYRIFDTKTWETLHSAPGPGIGGEVAYCQNERIVAVRFSGNVVLIDPKTGKIAKEIAAAEDVDSLDISPDGKLLVVGVGKSKADVWELSYPDEPATP